MTTNQRTVGGKPFPYKYKHDTFKRGAYSNSVYARVRDWLDANFKRERKPNATYWQDETGRAVAQAYWAWKGGERLTVVYDAEA
jgi:hypothetical protein